jgi:hypothetical protein
MVEKMNLTKHKVIVIMSMLIAIISIYLFLNLSKKKFEYPISPVVEEIFQYLGIKECFINSIGNYKNISFQLDNPIIEESEVDAYIDNILNDYNQEKLTKEFVREQFDLNSIAEFSRFAKKEVKESKNIDFILKTRKEILETIITSCKFSLNRNEVSEYALNSVDYYEEIAMLSNMNLDEYIEKILKLKKDEFYNMCYDEAENLIKTYLVIGVLTKHESLTVSEKDIMDFDDTKKTKEEDVYISYQILENKFYSLFIHE